MDVLDPRVAPPAPVPPFRLGHRRGLDGLRGLAILLVLLSHIPKYGPSYLSGGFVGVDLFFVLSGFLISTLLLEEWQESGRISLGAFYTRRALRLLPPLVVMLALVVTVSVTTEPPAQSAAMGKCAAVTLFYCSNWFLAFGAFPRPEVSATWSLSVEEQFYIFWPVLLLGMLRWKWAKSAMSAFVLAAIVASAAARAWLWSPLPGAFERVYFGTDTHADGLLLGCLAALCFSWGLVPRSKRWVSTVNWMGGASLVFLLLFLFRGWAADPEFLRFGYPWVNVAATALMVSLMGSPWAPLKALFESAPLVWIGRVSYGLYLWHIGAFWILTRTPWSGGEAHWVKAMGVTFLAAAVSFYAMERPLLRFKRRFERVRAAPAAAAATPPVSP